MISPHTPPGTHVIALVDTPAANGLPGLRGGALYTVAFIKPALDMRDEWAVVVHEHGPGVILEGAGSGFGYSHRAFRYVDLAGLDALLNARVQEPA